MVKFAQYGAERTVDQRAFAVAAKTGRRHLRRAVDGDRADQPRSGAHLHELRHGDQRSAVDGGVGQLWAGRRDRGSAGLRGAHEHRRTHERSTDRIAAVEQRISAEPVPGRGVQFDGRAGAVCAQPGGDSGRVAARERRCDSTARRRAEPDAGQPRDSGTHRGVRDGVSHAVVGSRVDGHVGRAGSMCWKCTAATPGDGSFASNCLLARRLAERGVRFIHLYHRGWDHHGNLEHDMPPVRPVHRSGQLRA